MDVKIFILLLGIEFMKDSDSKIDKKPWGFFEVISDESDHKVKRILVYPGKRLSYQRHFRRSEHWFIIRGEGLFTLDDENFEVIPYKSFNIPLRSAHRIENTGSSDLVFIEIQTGEYFGEDDIERLEDDYGRV